MPDLYTPIDGKPWPQERFARQAPTWAPSGVIGLPQSAYGNGPAALSFAVAGSVITVALAVFRANARGFLYERTDTPWQTGQAAASGSDATAAYALNTNSNPRRDRLVLRRDLAAGRIYPFILQGTPAASPTAPALTQVETGVWDTPLFSWTLAGSSSTNISNIVDERWWVRPDGRTNSWQNVFVSDSAYSYPLTGSQTTLPNLTTDVFVPAGFDLDVQIQIPAVYTTNAVAVLRLLAGGNALGSPILLGGGAEARTSVERTATYTGEDKVITLAVQGGISAGSGSAAVQGGNAGPVIFRYRRL